MTTNDLQLSILTERSCVRNDQISEFDVAIEIQSQAGENLNTERRALNLAVVIDRSGSMAGNKLETAKRSCLDISKRLGPQDLFTVVVFDDTAEVVVNPQTSRSEVADKISSLEAGTMTNLSLGWYLGLLELQTYMSDSRYNRLFLLSDGEANAGETKKAVLAKEASKSRELGITTSSIGIGDQFQEDLLEAIASESGGRFWYIQESRIDSIIEEEFKGSLSVRIDLPRIEVVLPNGLKISKELNNLKKFSGRYRCRPLKGQDMFNFALRLEVNPDAFEGEDDLLIEARLYDGEREVTTAEQRIPIRPAKEFFMASVNPIVKSVVQQYEISVSGEEMLGNQSTDMDLMKKLLIEEVGGMRRVQDALVKQREKEAEEEWERQRPERVKEEIRYLAEELLKKEASLLLFEMLEDFTSSVEVENFLGRWRKLAMRDHHHNVMRENVAMEFDEELLIDLLQDAIGLADLLAHKFPEKASMLSEYQEKIREQMARHQ